MHYKDKEKLVAGEPVMDRAFSGEGAVLLIENREELKIVETCFRIATCTGLPKPLGVFPFPVWCTALPPYPYWDHVS